MGTVTKRRGTEHRRPSFSSFVVGTSRLVRRSGDLGRDQSLTPDALSTPGTAGAGAAGRHPGARERVSSYGCQSDRLRKCHNRIRVVSAAALRERRPVLVQFLHSAIETPLQVHERHPMTTSSASASQVSHWKRANWIASSKADAAFSWHSSSAQSSADRMVSVIAGSACQ